MDELKRLQRLSEADPENKSIRDKLWALKRRLIPNFGRPFELVRTFQHPGGGNMRTENVVCFTVIDVGTVEMSVQSICSNSMFSTRQPNISTHTIEDARAKFLRLLRDGFKKVK